MSDLFAINSSAARLHPNFTALRDSAMHAHARLAMNEILRSMGDPNGNFRRDFIGEGFHARVFELAVFAYLDSAGFAVDRSYDRPDFLASREGGTIAIEATTSNPPDGADRDISVLRMRELPDHVLAQRVRTEFPRRIVSSLRKKVNNRYDQLAHCRGRPLVLAVGPFFEPGASCYTDEGLVECLYGAEDGPLPVEDEPFFTRATSSPVSAVLFCNQFTVPRFFRLSSGFPSADVSVLRTGVGYRDLDGEHFGIGRYNHWLGETDAPVESWHEGVTLFLNPLARTPLDPRLCPHTSRLWVDEEGSLRREVSAFHPVTSFMVIHAEDPVLAGAGMQPAGYAAAATTGRS